MNHPPALLETKQLTVKHLKKRSWLSKNQWLHILDNINIKIYAKEVVGLSGPSGCGKTTLAQAIMRLLPIHNGNILLDGKACENQPRKIREFVQLVFQDSTSALNPRQTVWQCLHEAIYSYDKKASSFAIKKNVYEILDSVGLPTSLLYHYPHSLSGGQRQRLCIARTLCRHPRILICDEITSALDVSTQAQILQLLLDLREKNNMALLWISHDLAILEHLCSRIYIMDQGKVIAQGDCHQLMHHPQHPLLKQMIRAAQTS